MDKIEFSIYKLVGDFFNNPLETLSSVYTLLIDKGYKTESLIKFPGH